MLQWFWRSCHLFFFLIQLLQWQQNKIVTGHKTYKLGSQTSDDHNSNMIQITSLVMKKMQFNHFSMISLWGFSVTMATKPRGRSP